MNIRQNNGTAAGQEVMHYHLHLIPRYSGASPDKKDFTALAEAISDQII